MIHLKHKVCGFYKLEAVKKTKSGKEKRRLLADWFPNLITNIGLDKMYDGGMLDQSYPGKYDTKILDYCMVGTDNTTPAFTDSILGTQVGYTTDWQSLSWSTEATSPYYKKIEVTFRFAEGVAEGNIAEVGLGWEDEGNYYCYSRALILDGEGSPTTITVLSDEYLDVSYEWRMYPKETDNTGSVTFTGSIGGTYDWTARLARAADWASVVMTDYPESLRMYYSENAKATSQDIQAITSYPTTDETGIDSDGADSYTTGDYYADLNFTVGLTQGNISGGIRSFVIQSGPFYYQIQFDPKIPKTDTDILTFKFRSSWGRV